jgi:halocyanin-like protein
MSEPSPNAGPASSRLDATADGQASARLDATADAQAFGRRAFLRAGVGATAAVGAAGASGTAAAQAYGGWMEDVSNFEATLDYTGQEAVTVAVGAGENSQLFDPPAILVDPGTTVTWEWTGEGGDHNVVHEPGEEGEAAFETELMSGAGDTFEYTFEESAAFRYYCSPHRPLGMKGVVAVGETDDQVVDPEAGGGGGGSGLRSTADFAVLAGAVGFGVALVAAVLSAADRPGGGA